MKVVLDCNVFVICLTSRSPYHHIYKSLIERKFELMVTMDILLEYEETIQLKYGLNGAKSFMDLLALLPNVHYVHPYYKWNLIYADPDDNKYCDCAVSGTADYIVTEDKHFEALRTISYPPIIPISIDDFSKILQAT